MNQHHCPNFPYLSNKNTRTTGSLDLSLSFLAEELGLDDNGDGGKRSVSEHLVESRLGDVDHRSLSAALSCFRLLFDVLGVAFAGAKSPLWVLPKQLNTQVGFMNTISGLNIIEYYLRQEIIQLTHPSHDCNSLQ